MYLCIVRCAHQTCTHIQQLACAHPCLGAANSCLWLAAWLIGSHCELTSQRRCPCIDHTYSGLSLMLCHSVSSCGRLVVRILCLNWHLSVVLSDLGTGFRQFDFLLCRLVLAWVCSTASMSAWQKRCAVCLPLALAGAWLLICLVAITSLPTDWCTHPPFWNTSVCCRQQNEQVFEVLLNE